MHISQAFLGVLPTAQKIFSGGPKHVLAFSTGFLVVMSFAPARWYEADLGQSFYTLQREATASPQVSLGGLLLCGTLV